MWVNAVFWGGPLDGEMRALQFQASRLRVEFPPEGMFWWSKQFPVTEVVPEYVEYELTDEVVDGCRVMKYVRPGGNPAG